MLEYRDAKRNRQRLLALTGLTVKEFKALLPFFITAYEQRYEGKKTLSGKKRKRLVGGGRRGGLKPPEQKLLFILVYLKTYPLQVVMGEMFELTQAGANQWIHRLLPVVQEALDKMGAKPERDGPQFAQSERGRKDPKDYIIDGLSKGGPAPRTGREASRGHGHFGTERRRQRPQDPKKQALHYSGKKQTHNDKNIVIANRKSKRIAFLGATYVGKTHDKRMADEAKVNYPRKSVVHKDTGFQGYEPPVQHTYQPKKSLAAKN